MIQKMTSVSQSSMPWADRSTGASTSVEGFGDFLAGDRRVQFRRGAHVPLIRVGLLTGYRGGERGLAANAAADSERSVFHRLDAIPVGLAIAKLLERDALADRREIFIAIDLGDGEALVLEELDELLLRRP